jgi:hypothetical protein
MPNVETQAASSPAEVVDPFKGEQVSMAEFVKFRQDGELPERFKPAEPAAPAPADTQESTEESEAEQPKPATESDPEEPQELKPKTAKRIQQLLEKTKELERKLAEKEGVKTDPPPVTAQGPAEPTPDDKNADGTPKFSTYEEYTKALARWEVRRELAEQRREQQKVDAQKEFDTKMNDVRARYEDADAVVTPTIKALNDAKLPGPVQEVFGTSPQFFDLCYELGSDPEELDKFISLAKTNPRAALKQVFAAEDKVERARDDKGKFVSKEAPEVKKTSAPKPPSLLAERVRGPLT